LEAHPLDPQEVKGLSIDDVKTAIAIYEHLGEACVGDNGIDNKRVDPRVGDVVWVIITVESDGNLRPVKEEGGRRLHGEDLSAFSLALVRREACRGPSVDHEAVVDLGEPLILVVTLGIFLFIILLDAYALKVPTEHVAVLEIMVRGPLMVGARFFEHFIEDTPAGGPRGFLRSAAATSSPAGASILSCWFFFFFLLYLLEPRLELAGSSALCFPLS
jgi:hypothetical protein